MAYNPSGQSKPNIPKSTPNVKQALGNAVSYIGDKAGIPETGLSEWIAGGPTKEYNKARADTSGSSSSMFTPEQLAQNQAAHPVGSNNYSGGSSRLDQLNAIGNDRNPDQQKEYDKLISDLKAGQQDDSRLIDEAYNSSFDYLNQAENQLRADQPTYIQEAEGNYNTNSALLGSQRDSAMGTLSGQETSATQRNLEAAAANRRLYSDLKMGYGQRFGGSSSAGQAASEIANVEQQRQQGKLQQSYGDTVRQIEGQKMEIQKSYDNGVMQLEQQKQQAINQVNRDFQNKLLEINKNRADINMNKAQARLGALQNLRNQIFQINVQNMQFKQTLEAQKQQAEQSLNSYGSTASSATSAGSDSLSSFVSGTDVNPQRTDLQALQTYKYNPTQMTGQISKKEDPYSGLMGSITNKPKSSFDFLSN